MTGTRTSYDSIKQDLIRYCLEAGITGYINFNAMDWDFIILRSKGDFSKAVALLKEEI